MKKNSNLLTRGKKVALMVMLATCLAGCAKKDNDNTNKESFSWRTVAALAFVGTGMYCLGYARGITK